MGEFNDATFSVGAAMIVNRPHFTFDDAIIGTLMEPSATRYFVPGV
jgi:hypothetical protein